MSARSGIVYALFMLSAAPVGAHRLDEYLQATTIAVEKGRVEAEMRLVPGVAVFPKVFADIDTDADGVASGPEQHAYAERVLDDVLITVDGQRLPLRLVSSTFASRELLHQGVGDIRLRFEADVPEGPAKRRLTFENHHQTRIGSYLVNGLVPLDRDIQLSAQQRSYDQSSYQLDYTDTSAAAGVVSATTWMAAPWGWAGALLALIAGGALLRRP
jgi:hypothetical protein